MDTRPLQLPNLTAWIDRLNKYECFWVVSLLITVFAIIQPELFFSIKSPMEGDNKALTDSSVSWAAFMPAWREFKYELFQHGNILWSNLRSFGLPMLANGVQGAPLFPLNLALIGLPDSLFWSVMPISRVILIAVGCYFISRHIFKLNIAASLVFAILVGFNLNILRWINHPWSNGVLASIWYLYFNCRVLQKLEAEPNKLIGTFIGLVVSVFAMITNGFPEAAAMGAILSLFVFVGFILSNLDTVSGYFAKGICLIILAHFIGLGLSSVQIFQLLEFIEYAGAMDLREGYISATIASEKALDSVLAQITHFWLSPKQLKALHFSTTLFGLFFFLIGAWAWLRQANKWIGGSLITLMSLFIAKAFGLSSILDALFSSTPVLAQSHFVTYFTPLFYFGFLYFSALGVNYLLQPNRLLRSNTVTSLSIVLTSFITTSLVALWVLNHHSGVELINDWAKFDAPQLFHLKVFFGFGILLMLALLIFRMQPSIIENSGDAKNLTTVVSCLLVICLISEVKHSQFTSHADTNLFLLNLESDHSKTFSDITTKTGLPKHELRTAERNGDFAPYGIATVNNGVSAMLPADQRLIRTKLFETRFGGYFPLDTAKIPWAWSTISNNLVSVAITPKSSTDWAKLRPHAQITARGVDWQNSLARNRQYPFYLEGTIDGYFKTTHNVRPYILFKSASDEFWIRANIASQQIVYQKKPLYRFRTNWRIRIPNDWLKEQEYQLTVRLVKEDSATYQDIAPVSLSLMPKDKGNIGDLTWPDLSNASLVTQTQDRSRHFYLNHRALPRSYAASGCDISNNGREIVANLVKTDRVLDGAVWVAETNASSEFCQTYQNDLQRIPIEKDRGSLVKMASVAGPVLAVLNDYFYPGWIAIDKLSGSELPIVRSNHIFRAVILPEAKPYEIEMRYRPTWLSWVYLLTSMSALALFVSILYLRRL